MLKYPLKNSVLISLFIFSLCGCSPGIIRGFKSMQGNSEVNAEVKPWFQADSDHFLFQSSVDVFRNHFSGLMVIKPLKADDYRVIFINEVGIKIFDMEFTGSGDYKIHYCLEYLNKKLFIKTLRNDLSLMLNNQSGKYLKGLQNSETGDIMLKFSDRSGIKYILVDNRSGKARQITRPGCTGKKVRITYYSNTGYEADSIRISHFNIKLDIHLSKINETR